MDTTRVMELYAPAAAGRGGQVGSAYRVGPGVVLTAAHVVAGLPVWPAGDPVPAEVGAPGLCWARPLGEPQWVPAAVAWRDDSKDVAVLRLAPSVPSLAWSSPPPGWGRIDGTEPVAVSAVGFPWAQERPDRVRDTEQLLGFIAPATMAKAGLLAVTVLSAAPAARAGGSPWAGMSGAALFAGPFLVGVIITHPARFDPDRVAAAPVAPLLADPDLAALLEASTDRLVRVGPEYAPASLAPTPAAGGQARAPVVDTLVLPPVMIGRADELGQLRAAARTASTGGRQVTIISVHGMGGAGKTALARTLATEIAGAFPDAQLEVDLHGFTPGTRPREAGEVLDELLRLVGFAATDIPGTTEGRSQLWRSFLSTRRTLLVLDNARHAAQVLPLLPGGAGSGRCLVMVTSRNRLAELETAASVAAGVLPAEDAVALLVHASHRDLDRQGTARAELETLAALCGFLPLALRPVGSLLAHLDPGELIEVMRSAQYPLQHLGQADQAAGAAFAVSYEALEEPLRDVLRACAWHPGPDFDADSIAVLIGQPRPLVTIALVELLDGNMLAELPGPRYGFHDMFLVYARREAGRRDEPLAVQAARQRLWARLLSRLETAAPLIYTDHQRTAAGPDPVGFTDRDGARAWLTAAAGELTAAAHAALADGSPGSGLFAGTLAYWLHAEGRSDQPGLLFQAWHAAARLAGDQDGQAAALAGLGLVIYARGEYQGARDAFRDALELYGQTGDRHAQAGVLKRLADVARVVGDHREAQDGYRHAYDLYQETGDRRGQADALTGLGDMAYARGESGPARAAYTQARDLCDQIGYRSGQADALCGLGDVALLDGEPDQAFEIFSQARACYLDIGNVHGLAYALKGLGDAAHLRGDHEQAGVSYGRARDLYEQIGFRNRYADVLRGLGDVARAEGDEDQADDLYRQAYAICEQIGYRNGQGDALKALADLAHARGKDELARDCYLRARVLYRQTGNVAGRKAIERALTKTSRLAPAAPSPAIRPGSPGRTS